MLQDGGVYIHTNHCWCRLALPCIGPRSYHVHIFIRVSCFDARKQSVGLFVCTRVVDIYSEGYVTYHITVVHVLRRYKEMCVRECACVSVWTRLFFCEPPILGEPFYLTVTLLPPYMHLYYCIALWFSLSSSFLHLQGYWCNYIRPVSS